MNATACIETLTCSCGNDFPADEDCPCTDEDFRRGLRRMESLFVTNRVTYTRRGSEVYDCPSCGRERLLHGEDGEDCACTPNPVQRAQDLERALNAAIRMEW